MPKRTLTPDELRRLLKKRQGTRTARAFAAELGIHESYLSDIYRGTRNPGNSILSKLNLVKKVKTVIEYESVA